jgi:hypothetical protein
MLPGDGLDTLGQTGCARTGGKAFFGTKELEGIALGDITYLSYAFMLHETTDPNYGIYINIFVDLNASGEFEVANDAILVYEAIKPGNTPGPGPMTLNTWYQPVAISSPASTGNWHAAIRTFGGISVNNPGEISTWDEMMSQPYNGGTVGDLKIVNPVAGCDGAGPSDDEGTGSGFVFAIGQKNGQAYAGMSTFLDAIQLEIANEVVNVDINLTLSETFTVTGGDNQTAEAGFVFDTPLSVTLLDYQGNPVVGETVEFVASDNDGATATFPNGSTTVTNASGVASVVAVASTTEGVFNVTATADGRTATFTLTNVAQAAFTTELILPQDIGGVDDFWQVDYYDNDPVNSPLGELAMNPAGVVNPLAGFGTSSFQMLPGLGVDTAGQTGCARTGGKVFLGTPDLAGVKLKDLKAFNFALLMEETTNAEGQPTLYYPPYINIYIDLDGINGWDPAVDAILVYDTAQVPNVPGNGPHTPLTWYETVAIGPNSTGAWRAALRSFGGIPTSNTPNPAHTWSTIVALPYTSPNGTTVGDLMIVNPDPGCDATADTDDEGTALGFNIQLGQKNGGSYNNSDHHLDKISVAVDGVLAPTTFDFALFGAPATIAITAGNDQSATVDTDFATALEVEVKDASGNPVIGETVTFTAPAAGASAVLTPVDGLAVTDAAGKASVAVKANTVAGAYTVTAQIGALAPVNFSLTNTVGAAASIAITAGDDQSTPVNTAFASPLEVEVTDAFANPIQGATVTFTAPASGASAVLSAAAVTDALGKTSVTATANGTIGSYEVTASTGALTPVAFSLENTFAPSATKIVIVSGNNQHATINTAFAAPLVVKITDAAGSPIEGIPVQFAVLTRQASVTFTPADGQDVSDATGEASVNVTANGTVGSYQVVVTAGAVFSAFDLTNDPDAAVAPTDLAAVATGQTTATVTWSSTSTSADTLALYRSTDGVNFTAIAAPVHSDTSYNDTGLICGTTYTYYLKVTNVAGTDDSNTDAITTTACTELLVNGSFELAGSTAKIPSGWTLVNATFDKRICNVLHAADGTCALQFRGGAGENSMFKQVLGNVSALTAGDTLYLSGAFKSSYAAPKVTVLVKVKYASLPVQKLKLSFLTTQAAYAYAADSAALDAAPTKVIVQIKNTSAGGKQYVDDVSLTLNDATRASGAVLPPPAAPDAFRGNN